jgi:hypothetical protein
MQVIEVWMDKIDMLPGQRWQQKIPCAIRNSDFILIFFSKNSVAKRGYYYNETLPSVADWLADLTDEVQICNTTRKISRPWEKALEHKIIRKTQAFNSIQGTAVTTNCIINAT